MNKIMKRLRSLGLNWKEWVIPASEWKQGQGFTWTEGFFGNRPFYDNILFACSSYCLLCCEVVAKLDLPDERYGPTCKIWVVKIPEGHVKVVGNNAERDDWRFLCLPVDSDNPFQSYDHNPFPVSSLEMAKATLPGWC
jgi:hypothetical protein